MDRELYKVLAKGDVNALKMRFESVLPLQMTHEKYSSLHVAVQFKKDACVEAILNACPSLLLNVNTKGDTALHIAARQGLGGIVKRLIDKAKSLGEEVIGNGTGRDESLVKQLIKMANNNNDTALHEAVRGGNFHGLARHRNFEVVKHLTEAYPEFEYFANRAGETPLYLAAKRGWLWEDAVRQILETCPSSAHGGPDGKTALHAAAMHNINGGVIMKLLEVKPNLTKEADIHGWTPLHYAAYISNSRSLCQLLLKVDSTIAYMLDKKGMSPLHVAAGRGRMDLVEAILDCCPDCSQVLDHRGRSYLHVAALRGYREVIENALRIEIMSEESLNQPDNDGNTPLHLAAICGHYGIVKLLVEDPRVNKSALNKKDLDAYRIILEKEPSEELDKFQKASRDALHTMFTGATSQHIPNINWEDLGIPREVAEEKSYPKKNRR